MSTSVKALSWDRSKFNVKLDGASAYEFTSYPTTALDANPFVFNFFGTKSCNLPQASHSFAMAPPVLDLPRTALWPARTRTLLSSYWGVEFTYMSEACPARLKLHNSQGLLELSGLSLLSGRCNGKLTVVDYWQHPVHTRFIPRAFP